MPYLKVASSKDERRINVFWIGNIIGSFDIPFGLLGDHVLPAPREYDCIDSALLHVQMMEGNSDFEREFIVRLEVALLDYIALEGDSKETGNYRDVYNEALLIRAAVDISKALILNEKTKSSLERVPLIAATIAKSIIEECRR